MPTPTTNRTIAHDTPPALPMKAYLVKKYKRPIEAGEAAEPTVGDRDVLVDIHAAGVNLLDAKVRDGDFKLILPYKPPFILGHDLAGRQPRRLRRDALRRG
jgi:D-arabinose 1-dehydrogenase-like Zn-dependent alcohol dehydrogenase